MLKRQLLMRLLKVIGYFVAGRRGLKSPIEIYNKKKTIF